MKSNINQVLKGTRRQSASLLFVLLVALCTCLSNTGHAQQNGYVYTYQFGDTELFYPYYATGVALDSKGNVFVAAHNNFSVAEYTNNGSYVMRFGNANAAGVAVDSAGNVFVVNEFGSYITKFNSTGTYVTKFDTSGSNNSSLGEGVAVDSTGNIFFAAPPAITKFSSTGTYIKQFSGLGSYATYVAVDSMGDVFASGYNSLVKFSNNGASLMQFGYSSGNGKIVAPQGVAVGGDGNVFVVDVYYPGPVTRFVVFDSNGTYITQANISNLVYPSGIAVDKDGKVFVSGTGIADDYEGVFVFAPAPSIVSITTNVTGQVITTDTFQATVTLDKPAPVDLDVQITRIGSALNPPATAHFPAGQTTATFTVNTNFITASETDTLTATLNSSSKSVNVTVVPISVMSISFPSSASADMVIPGTVKLNHKVPQGKTLNLTVSSSNVAAAQFTVIGGHSSTVVGGSDTANVAVLTQDVTMNTDTTLKAAASAEDPGMSTTMTVTPYEPLLNYKITPTRDKTTGDIVLSILVSDSGPAPTSNYSVTSATLNNVNTSTMLPTTPATFAVNGSTTVILHFPGSVGSGGQTVPFFLNVTYGNTTAYVITHGTVSGNVTLPYVQVSGTVTLVGSVNLAQSINFVFRPTNGGASFQRTQTLSATGRSRSPIFPPVSTACGLKDRNGWRRRLQSMPQRT